MSPRILTIKLMSSTTYNKEPIGDDTTPGYDIDDDDDDPFGVDPFEDESFTENELLEPFPEEGFLERAFDNDIQTEK